MRQIIDMDPAVKSGQPGYKLYDDDLNDISSSEERVLEEIQRVFSGVDMAAPTNIDRVFIQGPHRNTQILSHIHSFMIGAIPPTVEQNYIDASYILEVKKDFMDDVPLVRTRTPPPPIAQQEAVDFEQDDDGLTRQSTVTVNV